MLVTIASINMIQLDSNDDFLGPRNRSRQRIDARRLILGEAFALTAGGLQKRLDSYR